MLKSLSAKQKGVEPFSLNNNTNKEEGGIHEFTFKPRIRQAAAENVR
jgi:hypothetical protein